MNIQEGWEPQFRQNLLRPRVRISRFLSQLVKINTVCRPQEVTLSVMRTKSFPSLNILCKDKIKKRLKNPSKTIWIQKEPL